MSSPDTAGECVAMDQGTYDAVDLNDFVEESRYKFLTGSVVPRPIALVTSVGKSGVLNAAPYSQFVIVSVTPPLLGIVAHEGEHGQKDTVRNILETGEFVINTVSERMANQVQQCAEPYPPEISEVTEVGFHTLPSLKVGPPRVAESPLHFECKLHRTIDFGVPKSRTMLVVGEVVMVHCAEGVRAGHRIDHLRFNPLGRIAGRSYCKTGDTLNV